MWFNGTVIIDDFIIITIYYFVSLICAQFSVQAIVNLNCGGMSLFVLLQVLKLPSMQANIFTSILLRDLSTRKEGLKMLCVRCVCYNK
jgi:hypothetical protein